MALVQIPRAERADYEADLRRLGLSSYTAVIDAQPNLADYDRSGVDNWAKCASCSFVHFLDGLEDIARFSTLVPLKKFFALLPGVVEAISTADSRRLYAAADQLGATACYQICRGAAPVRFAEVPVLRVIGAADDAALVGPRSERCCLLLEPGRHGIDWVLERLRCTVVAGYGRALIGYHQHASAMDHWSDFLESADFSERWPALIAQAQQSGLSRFGMMMAYPPCASLQWPQNLALERLRARLDLHFRALEKDSSLMCPENVSGYALANDTRPVVARTKVFQHNYAIRFEQVIFLLAGT
jgi:hypothetical protein